LRRRSLRRQLRALAVEVPGSPDLGLVESGRALCGVVLGASSQILVSTAVMRALSTAQWEMVLAHERAHLRRGDALVQELICFLGPVGPWGSLQAAWRAAAEEAADDEAAASGQGWLLAEALVAVAGLPPAPHPGPALLHEGVEARVRRLLQGPRVARPARWAPGAAAISLAGAASLYLWAEGAHHGLETLRHHLLGP
jgi:hypothetical protein